MGEKKDDQEFTPPDMPTVTPPEGYTADEWQSLSQQEREGVLDSIANPEIADADEADDIEERALKDIAGEEEDKGAEEGNGQEAEGEEDESTDGEVSEKAEDLESSLEKTPAGDNLPKTDADLLNFKAVVTDDEIPAETFEPSKELKEARDQALASLKEKWETGEIDDDTYQNQRDDIRDEYTRKSILATQGNAEEVRKDIAWQKEQRAFYDVHTEYLGVKGQDGKWASTPKSSGLWGALNAVVTDLENTRPGLTGMKLLVEAHKIVAKEFGLQRVQGGKGEKGDKGKPPAEVPDLNTLGDIPPAGNPNPRDQWAMLDRLTGEAYENALNRLSPAQREAYLSQV